MRHKSEVLYPFIKSQFIQWQNINIWFDVKFKTTYTKNDFDSPKKS